MSIFNRNEMTGILNQSPQDEALKVEIHHNAHTSILNVNSEDRTAGSTYASAHFQIGGEILQSKINKLALYYYRLDYCISNINERNNIISFFSTNSAAEHTVTLTPGHYAIDALVNEIITQLNSVDASSGLTFDKDILTECTYNITSTGGDFRFLPSSHINRAGPCSGLFSTLAPTNNMIITVGGEYTKYIDVVIPAFRDAQILENSFTKDNTFPTNGHMVRIDISPTEEDSVYKIESSLVFNLNYVSIRNKELSTLDVFIYDQFGEPIYSPAQEIGGSVYNIPLMKYLFKFSISA